MASAAFPHKVFRHGFMCLATAGLLMGCVEGGGSSSGTGSQTTAAPASRGGSAREVEAPDVFQVTDSALWDGRPSLGGIWVASPNATEPERVVILNPATGKSVNGALFRRERENPGPPLQVSSDAAEALGMLAGQPTSIQVTALRKPAEATPPAETTAVAAAAPAEAATDTAAGDPAAETAALAAAALAATGTAVETATEAAPEAAAAATAAADGAVDGAVEAVAAEPPKPKTWKERRAEAKARREAEKAAKAAAAATAAAEAGTEGAAAAEPAATADSVAVATVETAPLDARAPEVAAAADAVAAPEATAAPEPVQKKTRRQIREEQKAAEAAAAAAAATAAAEATDPAAQPATAGRQIQIASFSKEENANRAIEALAKVNVTAQAQRSEQGGTTVWGVVATGDDALLASIKKAGFADAFFLN